MIILHLALITQFSTARDNNNIQRIFLRRIKISNSKFSNIFQAFRELLALITDSVVPTEICSRAREKLSNILQIPGINQKLFITQDLGLSLCRLNPKKSFCGSNNIPL